jgi:hypothetical protein
LVEGDIEDRFETCLGKAAAFFIINPARKIIM